MKQPTYQRQETVEFEIFDKRLIGMIVVVDAKGTLFQKDEPYYDIAATEEKSMVYKHVPESQIIQKV